MENSDIHKNSFHPLVGSWFAERFDKPTPIQTKAWSRIATDQHVLITAPTGSGKTLAAFLWALNKLIIGAWEMGETRVLYVSPLKALNNDIQKNLLLPLDQLQEIFEQENRHFPLIRVMTRSGDTPSSQRRNMIRQPPEILITTPESLHLMLSSHGGRSILCGIKTVIMDEIHAIVGNKRGTLFISGVDRLVELSGEFQRIALSATVNPIRTVADFVGGYRIEGNLKDPVYHKRRVEHCNTTSQRTIDIAIRLADAVAKGQPKGNLWSDMADQFRQVIEQHHSTIIFVNSRQLCEKLTFLINADRPMPIAYSHHGSLSKELRFDVEKRLKNGKLKAIVATATLELGIDIGSLDHVILVQSPPTVSSAIQRIGRAGHGVGKTSKASIFPTHAMDTLNAAVLAKAVFEKKIEPVQPIHCPLDVLSQLLISMIGIGPWDIDELYHTVRATTPFHDLRRKAFDLVIEMLAGRYASTRIPSLKPKIALDRLDNKAVARKGALLSLYSSGGVIPDRGYFSLRHGETGARIGELDEEFVWEAKKGQVFTLGTQNWRIERITHNNVFVRSANPRVPAPPFWRAEELDRDFHLSEMIGCFLEKAEGQGIDGAFSTRLKSEYEMDSGSAEALVEYLKKQQNKTNSPLPHRHHVLVERFPSQNRKEAGYQVVLHTFWGGKVNRPFALALEAFFEKEHGVNPPVFPTNDAVYLLLPPENQVNDIMSLVRADSVENLLRRRLEGSGIFGARFRECAARALLLPRKGFKQRMPLWLNRQRSQKLLDTLGRFAEFPILLEAWRTCLQDDFDMASLERVLTELESGKISCTEIQSQTPSPMALSGAWRLINQFMYADDRQQGRVKTDISDDLLTEVVFNAQLRPSIDPDIIDEFTRKRQRVYPDYAPDSPLELLEWVKERLLIPEREWICILDRAENDHGVKRDDLIAPIVGKLCFFSPDPVQFPELKLVVATEFAFQMAKKLYLNYKKVCWSSIAKREIQPFQIAENGELDPLPETADIVSQWLCYYGPVTTDFISGSLGLDKRATIRVCKDLLENRIIISGLLIRDRKEDVVCNADNFETLLRIARRKQKADIQPKNLLSLSPILARYQKITSPGRSFDDLVDRLQPLLGYPLSASLWETEILPARIPDYDPQWMDRILIASDMIWKGYSRGQLIFCHSEDLDLVENLDGDIGEKDKKSDENDLDVLALFPNRRGRYTLADLMAEAPERASFIRQLLWKGFWEGSVTTDSMVAIRQELTKSTQTGGVQKRQNRGWPDQTTMRRRRRRHDIKKGGTFSTGTWQIIAQPDQPEGLVEVEELGKERVRLLMDRYGILFRQLVARELPALQWSEIFRSIRLMELSGEVVAGYFFQDIPGLQFVSKKMLRFMQDKPLAECVFWINAQDPASICGLGIDALKGKLPKRLRGTHLVFLGNQLALVSEKSATRLSFNLPADHPRIAECLCVFDHLLTRKIDPRPSLTVEVINGENAVDSTYLEVFKKRFDIYAEERTFTIYRTIGDRIGNE
jgi:ATP-dependent Lhr-like helicase